MKFVSIRDFRSKSAQVQERLKNEKEIILTSNGKPVAVMASVTDEDYEDTLNSLRKVRAIQAVNALQAEAIKFGRDKISKGKINSEISKSRKRRKSG